MISQVIDARFEFAVGGAERRSGFVEIAKGVYKGGYLTFHTMAVIGLFGHFESLDYMDIMDFIEIFGYLPCNT